MGEMQMDALEALMTRRSVRAYTDEPVTDDQVRKIGRRGSFLLGVLSHA
jgi:hypothetical protein